MKRFEYNERNKDQEDDFIIPPYLFEEPKQITVVEFPFCKLNEKRVSVFRKKFNYFTNDNYDLNIVWKTKKVRSFFPLKNKKCIHHAKLTMAYVHVEKIRLKRPNKMFLYVVMNITSPLKSQNQVHTWNGTLMIISLGGSYVMHNQMLEHIRILRRFL